MVINFDNVAGSWDKESMHIQRASAVANAILKKLPITKSKRALEFGAGTGQLSFLLQKKFNEIYLVDNSKGMLEVLSEKISNSKLTHLYPINFDINNPEQCHNLGRFDVVYMMMTLHHIIETEKFLQNIYLLLNERSKLFICDLDREDGSFHEGETDVIFGFDRDQLARTMTKLNFKNPKFETVFSINKNNKDYPVFLLHTYK